VDDVRRTNDRRTTYYGRATDVLRACKINFLVLMFDIYLFCLYKFLMGLGLVVPDLLVKGLLTKIKETVFQNVIVNL
jgi:hypothetical protein